MALLIALMAVVAPPLSGIAHAAAHARDLSGAVVADHHRAPSGAAEHGSDAARHFRVGTPGAPAGDHPHADLGTATGVKGPVLHAAVVALRVDLPVAFDPPAAEALPLEVVQGGPDPAARAPARPRPPPSVTG